MCDLRVSSTIDDAVAVREGLPVGRRLAGVLLELVEELAVVELEAHVVGDAAAELGDLEEHPVGEAVGREHAIVRAAARRAPPRPPRAASTPRTTISSRAKSEPATARSAAASPTAIPTFSLRRGSPGFLLSSLWPIATGTKTMHASANQTIPRIAFTPPAKVSARTAKSKTREAPAPEDHEHDRDRRERVEEHRVRSRALPSATPSRVRRTAGRRGGGGSSGPSSTGPYGVARTASGARTRSATLALPGRSAAADQLVGAEEHHEQRAEGDAPVDVRPDDEEREREPDTSRRLARLGGEQPEEARVQRQREHLGADRPAPRRRDEHRQEHHPDRARARPRASARRQRRSRRRATTNVARREREQREAAQASRCRT